MSSGAVIIHNFSYNCKIAPFRSIQTLRSYSSNGTIVTGKIVDKDNDYEILDVRYLDNEETIIPEIIVKRGAENTVLEISDSASGVTWTNPYGDIGLSDQDTAIADIFTSMAADKVLYDTTDEFIDTMIIAGMKQSIQKGLPVNFGNGE